MGPTLNQTLRVEQPLFGQAPRKQTVNLTGTPAKVGGWLWRVSCPETGNRRGCFTWRQMATGSKADRALRRCFSDAKTPDRSFRTRDRPTPRHE